MACVVAVSCFTPAFGINKDLDEDTMRTLNHLTSPASARVAPSRIKALVSKTENPHLRMQLSVIYALHCLHEGQPSEFDRVKKFLERQSPGAEALEFLGTRYTTEPCQQCGAQERGGRQARPAGLAAARAHAPCARGRDNAPSRRWAEARGPFAARSAQGRDAVRPVVGQVARQHVAEPARDAAEASARNACVVPWYTLRRRCKAGGPYTRAARSRGSESRIPSGP